MSSRYFGASAPRMSRSTLIIIILAVLLAGALSLIVYLRYYSNRTAPPIVSTPRPGSTANTSTFSSFLASLKNSDAETKRAHNNFYQYIATLDQNSFPTAEQLKQLVEGNEIPHDYLFFFKECLPSYSRSLTGTGSVFNDPHILVSLPRNAQYKASLFVNTDNLPVEAAYSAVKPQGTPNRIVMSGAYTSPTRLPAGLAIDKGKVINPVLQDFDGLIQIWPEGQMQIGHIDSLQDDLKSLRVRTSFSDYIKFMKLAEQANLTVLQSSMLINNGELLVKEDQLLKKLQRRVIFQMADDSLHVFDSLDKEQTLFETAQYLKDHYRAQRAINLETGTYSFCTVNRNNKLANHSNAKAGIVISNFIVIDF